MIKQEYQNLLGRLEQALDNKSVALEEILRDAVSFFDSLRQEFPKAPKEEREEMIQMMTQLHAKLQEVSKKTAEDSGMTEEELAIFADNPSNFTPEQWQLVQGTKRKLYDSARKFSASLETEKGAGEAAPKKGAIRPRTGRRAGRKDWKKT